MGAAGVVLLPKHPLCGRSGRRGCGKNVRARREGVPLRVGRKAFSLTCRETCEDCRPGVKVSVGQCGWTGGRAPEAMDGPCQRILRKAGPRRPGSDRSPDARTRPCVLATPSSWGRG